VPRPRPFLLEAHRRSDAVDLDPVDATPGIPEVEHKPARVCILPVENDLGGAGHSLRPLSRNRQRKSIADIRQGSLALLRQLQ
jgi:hypothetical protein